MLQEQGMQFVKRYVTNNISEEPCTAILRKFMMHMQGRMKLQERGWGSNHACVGR